METVDGKKVKPITDVDKAQQAAKEKYQAAKLEETTTSEKLKEFEKANPFDIKSKGEIEAGNYTPAKFSDAKKQKEYDTLSDASYKASKATSAAGAEYTAAEGVTNTQEFTDRATKRSNKSELTSESKKIEGLKKRGYSDKDLGRDDTLTQNFIRIGDAKYPLTSLDKYEAVVKKELDAPIDAKAKDGQIAPNETVAGKSVTAGVGARGPNNAGNTVAKTSSENADMSREASKGGANNTVVSNNVSSNNTTKIVPMKANPRPEYTGSSLDRYTNRITVY
jgi:hypothetical protein